MSAIAKKKPYAFKTTYMTVNQRMYGWADHLFFDQIISSSLLHTLKAIIATRHMTQPTIQQINDARIRSASTKFAQADSVDNRTVRRHVKKLETINLIKVNRTSSQWKSRNAYAICVPDEFLVKQHEDIVSSSLSCSSSLSEKKKNSNFKKQTKKENYHTSAAAHAPDPDGSALAAAFSWQDELRGKYEQRLMQDLTPGQIRDNAKIQFNALKRMLRGR